jgi:class 3 adenylate cyclase/predicted ATPase
MDLGSWLQSLGLERYEAAFRENEITEKVLPNLTAEDLKDMGVSIVGHRRALLDAIAVLHLVKEPGSAPSKRTAESAVPTKDTAAERRQVTVMFSDLVGSTALSARMDPEDLREVISAYQKCVAQTVGRFGGFVAKYMGDGVLVYFGYPKAHEDDAERAARAALELVAAVRGLKTHETLKTRVGIATGLVIVGDLIGSGASQEEAIVGETPNLAATLQAIAEPNTVVIAESTRKLLGDLFELEDLGSKELKGIAGPVRSWAAVRPASVESRFEALHATGLTDLIGREEELDLLLRRWTKAKNGEGQVVLLSGEPGIGKSRLIAALLERLASEPHTRLRYFCSPQRTDSAFFPIISQMERAAGFAQDDTVKAKLDKLDTLMAQSQTSPQDIALFAEMLSLPNDGRYPMLDLTPQQRRQKTLEALRGPVETFASKKPVLMILEDAHWADPTSLEVFNGTVDRTSARRGLLIITFRPEFEPPWIGQPHVTSLTLSRLTRRDVDGLIDRVAGNKPMPANLRQEIIERTDGIPLFVEEMTKAVLEAESQSGAERTAAAVPSAAVAVPVTLHASLMARLDRLGPSKEVAQIGAAIGREFSHALLAAVTRKPEGELQPALDSLVAAGLLFRQGVAPHATYLFKHALVQDAAYGTLLREPRRALHARIAETLENQFAEIAENQPELLARHCTEAGLIEKAAGLWGKAGQRSVERSALVEAIEQLTRALNQIETLPATPALRRAQIRLQIAAMSTFWLVKGSGAPETIAAAEQAHLLLQQAKQLGEPLEDPLLLFAFLYGLWIASFMAFDGDAMRERAALFMKLAEEQGATAPLMIAHRLMGVNSLFMGDTAQARAYLDQSIALFNPLEHRPLSVRFGADAAVSALSFLSMALWALGHPEAALANTERALNDARKIGQATTSMLALFYASLTHTACGNYVAAKAQYDELIALADDKGVPLYGAFGTSGQGCLFALAGEASDAVHKITSGISAMRSSGIRAHLPFYLSFLASAHAELGQLDDGWRCIEDAIMAVETTGERWCEAEVNRVAGEIALLSPEPEKAKAEEYFDRALEVSRKQQAKSWELRAAMSMARLWRPQGKPQQARELLAPVYGWFTEGFDTLDLKEAKALLDELAP